MYLKLAKVLLKLLHNLLNSGHFMTNQFVNLDGNEKRVLRMNLIL